MSCAPPLKTLLKKNGSLQISFHSTGISQEHVLHDLLHASHGSGDLASLAVISKLESVYARRSTVEVGGSIPRSAARSMCWRLSSAEGGSVPHMSTWPEGSSIERSHNNTFAYCDTRETHTRGKWVGTTLHGRKRTHTERGHWQKIQGCNTGGVNTHASRNRTDVV